MEGYISIKQIADDINEHPLLRDVTFERIINYVVELIRIVGCPKMFTEKTTIVDIKNHRGVLPCDFVNIIQVRGTCGEEYVGSMNNFHTSDMQGNIGVDSYKIQGNVIITSLEEGAIEIAYRAIELDEDGLPLVPDNAAFIRAIENYIKLKRFTILFDQNKVSQAVLANTQQEYDWSIGQAQASFTMPTIDEMEALSAMWNNLIPEMMEHSTGFAGTHNRDYLRRH